MKFFQAIRNPLNILGLNQPVASQTKFLNWRNVLVLVGLGQLSTICGLFIMLEATTLKEYADCFYISVTAFLNFFIIVIFVQNTANLFELINGFESVTKKRKSIKVIKVKTHFIKVFSKVQSGKKTRKNPKKREKKLKKGKNKLFHENCDSE